jgi:hypothetical protein
MKGKLFITIAALAVSTAAVGQQKTVVPAYFGVPTQTDPSKGYDWTRIATAGSAVLAVVADGSFPGNGLTGTCNHTSPPDTYCGPCSPSPGCSGAWGLCQAKCQFVVNHNAGQLVLGYVDTNFACTNNTVASQETLVANWYLKYSGYIQGIFYDDGPTLISSCPPNTARAGLAPLDETTVQRPDYNQVYGYVHDPTTYAGKVMLNASQFKNEWVMKDPAADYAVVFEKSYYDWTNNFFADQNNGQPAAWWTSPGYSGKLAHVAFSAKQTDVSTAVNRSRTSTYGSPVIYLFDRDATQPSAYAGVACFFEQQVAALQNQPAVSGTTWCSNANACVDLNTQAQHCGDCNTACSGTANGQPNCSNGVCGIVCNSGYTLCGSSCDNLSSDVNHCGSCTSQCTSTQTCSGGSCIFDCSRCSCGCNLAHTVCFRRGCPPTQLWDDVTCRCTTLPPP